MKNYTVIWSNQARNELAKLWLASLDRRSFTRASDELDRALGNHPDLLGSPLSEGLRQHESGQICILFWIDAPNRQVKVESVRFAPPHS